jgi:hypothetical protein
MAKNTAKSNIKTNAVRLRNFWIITVVCNIVHLAVLYFTSGFGIWPLLGVAFWASQQIGAMKILSSRGAPTYEADGSLVDCVNLADADQLGFASYAQDLLWVCWALQVLANVVSGYFSMIYVVVPVYGFAKAWSGIISPLLQQRSQMAQMAAAQQASANPADAGDDDPRSRLAKRRAEVRGNQKGIRK